MTVRMVLGLFVIWGSMGCNDRVGVGSTCFDSPECRKGLVCTETVYGNFCLETCEAGMVTCEDRQACVEGISFEAVGGAGGAGGEAGAGGMGGSGGGGIPTDLFVCLPGADLDADDFEPVLIGEICTVSIDCELGGICVCLEGENCDLSDGDRDGPICVEVCDPTMLNRCPLQQACVDLGDGRGFCDPMSVPPPTGGTGGAGGN